MLPCRAARRASSDLLSVGGLGGGENLGAFEGSDVDVPVVLRADIAIIGMGTGEDVGNRMGDTDGVRRELVTGVVGRLVHGPADREEAEIDTTRELVGACLANRGRFAADIWATSAHCATSDLAEGRERGDTSDCMLIEDVRREIEGRLDAGVGAGETAWSLRTKLEYLGNGIAA
jgi:hypothetical protein